MKRNAMAYLEKEEGRLMRFQVSEENLLAYLAGEWQGSGSLVGPSFPWENYKLKWTRVIPGRQIVEWCVWSPDFPVVVEGGEIPTMDIRQ